MHWQENIFDRLNLKENTNKIVLDYIGLLVSDKFLDFLNKQEIIFFVAENVKQVLNGIKDHNLVISKPLTLPNYLSSKTQIVEFDSNLLPIDVDPNVLSKLTIDQLSSMLEYLINQKKLTYVRSGNYLRILQDAENYKLNTRLNYIEKEVEHLLTQIGDYKIILTLGRLWGEYVYLCYKINRLINDDLLKRIDQTVEPLIIDGMTKNAFYSSVSEPKTVDKILSFIKKQKKRKIALICFDGMGVSEWFLLKEYLENEIDFKLIHLFALIPTITSISRASIFYANTDKVYDLKSINEDKAFKEFFVDKNVASYREDQIDNSEKLLGIDAVKIIYNVFDSSAHKTILPPSEKSKGLYFKSVINYLERSSIKKELLILKEVGFKIWFCSDHGSVLATGNGQKIDKYLIEISSKRGTIVKNSELAKFYDVNSMEIPFIKNKLVLLAKNRTSFSSKKTTEITHGGITLDELIVPFVEIIN